MAQNNDAAVEVEHNGETVEVPKTFEQVELAAYFGGVPGEWEIDYVFAYDGALRTGAYVGDGEWVEAVLHTDDWHETFNAHNDRGWVAETIDVGDDASGCPGTILWEAE